MAGANSPRTIPVAVLPQGIRLALEYARALAIASTTAAQADHLRAAAVLLYQAAEEVGKAVLLTRHLSANEPVPFDARSEFRDHAAKFVLAAKTVPSDCLQLTVAGFDAAVFDVDAFDAMPAQIDWARRQDALYLNWDEATGQWAVPGNLDRRVLPLSAARLTDFIENALGNGLP